MQTLRVPAVGLGVAYLLGIALLGPLLGSTADASSAYAAHYEDDANVARDLLGALALVLAAGCLVWTTVAARRVGVPEQRVSTEDLVAAGGLVSATAILVAAGLLATVPLTTAIGNLTDDPGIDDVAIQAGIAQVGTVVLLVAMLPLAATTLLLARLGKLLASTPRSIAVAAWAVAAGLLLGASVIGLVPFGLWAIALGVTWRNPIAAATD